MERENILEMVKELDKSVEAFSKSEDTSIAFRSVFSSLGHACRVIGYLFDDETSDEAELQVLSDVITDLHTILTSTYDNFGFLFEKKEDSENA